MNKRLMLFGTVAILAGFVACGDDRGGATGTTTGSTGTTPPTFTVSYDANGGSGTVPTDSTAYTNGQVVTLAAGSGLTQGGFVFLGWGTNAAGTGKRVAAGDSLTMGAASLTMYAQYGLVPEMVVVPSDTDGVSIGWPGIVTSHAVASLSAFRVGKYEVTWALWTNVRTWATNNGYTISAGSGNSPQHPVTTVSHRDALAWCNALSERSGLTPVYYTESAKTVAYRNSGDATSTLVKTSTTGANGCVLWTANGYRLPTEAEWEYAARRKSDGSLSDGDKPAGYTGSALHDDANVLAEWGPYAWYLHNAISSTHIVGDRLPNALGLFDMSGNVSEWCWDWFGNYVDGSP